MKVAPVAPYVPMKPELVSTLDAGFDKAQDVVNRLLDRATELRVEMRNDLKARSYRSDTVRGVQLLTRARDYAVGQMRETLGMDVEERVFEWAKANSTGDGRTKARINAVNGAFYDLDNTLVNVLDDDEGNVREEIASMRTEPGKRSWQAVYRSLDGAISGLYELRGSIGNAEYVVGQERRGDV